MSATLTPLFGFFGLGTQEIMLLLVLGVLLFGRNLPSLGRSLGKTVTEFKRGVKGGGGGPEKPTGAAPRGAPRGRPARSGSPRRSASPRPPRSSRTPRPR